MKKRKVLAGSKKKIEESPKINFEESVNVEDVENIVDSSIGEVVSNLTEKKRKKHSDKYWGDRPENLRKGLSEMTADEKQQYYLWKAGGLKPEEKEKDKLAYEQWEVSAIGALLLPMLAKRLPVQIEVSNEEIENFGKCFTPLVNKYVGEIAYKEEIAALIFACAFAIPRVQLGIQNVQIIASDRDIISG